MREQDLVIKHISLLKFKDPRIVKEIVYHPIVFAKHVMADPDDYRPIRIRYFGAFVLKFMHNKAMFKKLNFISQALSDHPDLYKMFVDPSFNSSRLAMKYVKLLWDANDLDSINAIHDFIIKAIEDK